MSTSNTPDDGDALMVYVSAPPDAAAALASTLVAERFAACVSVLPGVRSVYRWNGAVQQDEESLLLIKTGADRFEALRQRIVDLHPYELPEVVAVRWQHAHEPYRQWVLDSTRP